MKMGKMFPANIWLKNGSFLIPFIIIVADFCVYSSWTLRASPSLHKVHRNRCCCYFFTFTRKIYTGTRARIRLDEETKQSLNYCTPLFGGIFSFLFHSFIVSSTSELWAVKRVNVAWRERQGLLEGKKNSSKTHKSLKRKALLC